MLKMYQIKQRFSPHSIEVVLADCAIPDRMSRKLTWIASATHITKESALVRFARFDLFSARVSRCWRLDSLWGVRRVLRYPRGQPRHGTHGRIARSSCDRAFQRNLNQPLLRTQLVPLALVPTLSRWATATSFKMPFAIPLRKPIRKVCITARQRSLQNFIVFSRFIRLSLTGSTAGCPSNYIGRAAGWSK